MFQQNWQVLKTCYQQERDIFASKYGAFGKGYFPPQQLSIAPWRWNTSGTWAVDWHISVKPQCLCLPARESQQKFVKTKLPSAVPKKPPRAWLRVAVSFGLEEDIPHQLRVSGSKGMVNCLARLVSHVSQCESCKASIDGQFP